MVDRELLNERLKLLSEYLEDLEELQKLTYEDFVQDKRTRRYVERTLHLAVECCLDISSHIIADLKLREPGSYADMFTVLAENSIIPHADLPDLQKMAQFRNVIVHHYARIDPEIVFRVLKRNLGIIRGFGEHMNALL
jgi:uncharacterized protein YutE (UPF0331/DUF86 family)